MLNPLREQLSQAGVAAQGQATPFAGRAADELARFRVVRGDLERQVRRGDLTLKVARERARTAADEAASTIRRQAEGYSPTPRAFLDRLVAAAEARRQARDGASLESLQRETNRLLRQSVVELQLAARAGEFEGKTFTRPMGGGSPAPTLDALLGLARLARDSGDDVAEEWSRRQLEAFRTRSSDPGELRQIDLATDRPDVVNLRLVQTYLAAIEGQGSEALATFVAESIASGDANACVAAFALVRRLDPDAADPVARAATRKLLAGLDRFPDAALATLRTWEGEARAADAEAAQAQVTFLAASLAAESRLPGLEAPTAEAIDRASRLAARPEAQPGESFGLNLARRGRLAADPVATADDPRVDDAGPVDSIA